jgi:hypothetical protein
MLHNRRTNPIPQQSRLPWHDAKRLWLARDVYRLQRFLLSAVATVLLLEAAHFLLGGRWDLALLVPVGQTLLLGGTGLLLRSVWRCARRRWHGRVAMALVGMGLTLGGCESLERGVAKMYGIKVDPLPGPCAPESLQARQCLAVQQEGKKP